MFLPLARRKGFFLYVRRFLYYNKRNKGKTPPGENAAAPARRPVYPRRREETEDAKMKEKHNMMEILAPVGGMAQLTAAVRCGADALYLGARGFNARANAENFADLGQVVAYAHARGVKVHITLNTLIQDEERPALIGQIEEIAASGADAVIVQDLGVAALVRQCCPDIALHASTQMSIHSPAGVRQLEEMGFARVVLARELTLAEIRQITAATSLETEVFVHGALCMSVSGQCYLSSLIGGRSGNRGRCAQPCRLDFRLGGYDHALSLKDLSLIYAMKELQDAGVCSLKIEGRMKRPEYVAAAVTACRDALAGKSVDLERLEAVFSRSGFTDGYFTGRRNHEMFGYRTKEDVVRAAPILGELAASYRRETPRVGVDMAITLRPDMPVRLKVSDGVRTLCVTGQTPQAARQVAANLPTLARSLKKTGGTPFYVREVRGDVAPGLMLPVSAVNQLRKQALDQLLAQREEITPHPFYPPQTLDPLPAANQDSTADLAGRMCAMQTGPAAGPAPAGLPPARGKHPLRLRITHLAQLERLDGIYERLDALILPLAALAKALEENPRPAFLAAIGPARIIAEIPALVFGEKERQVLKQLRLCREKGIYRASAGGLGALWLARQAGMTATGDYGLNLLHSGALEQAAKLGLTEATLSFEASAAAIRQMPAVIPRGIIAYGYLPLMLLRACPARGRKGCGACDGQRVLTDRLGNRFALWCQQREYAILLNTLPLQLSDRLDAFGALDFFTLYFTGEDAGKVRQVCGQYLDETRAAGKKTGGMYFRRLQ